MESRRKLEDDTGLSALKALTDVVADERGNTWDKQGYKNYDDAEEAFARLYKRMKPTINRIRLISSITNKNDAEQAAIKAGYGGLAEFVELYNKYLKYLPFWFRILDGLPQTGHLGAARI